MPATRPAGLPLCPPDRSMCHMVDCAGGGASGFARPVEDFRLSEILPRLQIQAIYRESTGNRLFRFSRRRRPGWGPGAAARAYLWRKCKRPAAVTGVRARFSQKSETRISAIADFAGKGKQEKKALPLSLLAGRRHDNPGALEKSFPDISRCCRLAHVPDVDSRDIGERSDAVLRTAMPGHDDHSVIRLPSSADQ